MYIDKSGFTQPAISHACRGASTGGKKGSLELTGSGWD